MLVVRLTSGGEDQFEPFPGCEVCGYPTPKKSRYCKAHERTSVYSTRNESEIRWFNHVAIEEADGSLTVKRVNSDSNPAGRYPKGSWVTYRTT